MTAIVGIVDGSRVWLGGDRCIASNGSRETLGTPKVWHAGGYVLGVAGSSAWHSLVRRVALPTVAGDRYPLAGWIEDLLSAARALGLDLPVENDESPLDGTALLAGGGGLWYVDSALECYRTSGESAIGTGADAARGAMFASRAKGRRRVLTALEAAAHVCTDVWPPFDVIAA